MQIGELISEIQAGSRAAQQLLFSETAGPMMALCGRYLKKKEDAEEAMLNGYLKAFTHIGRFQYQNDAAFYGWLKRLMVNECLMFLRKKHVFLLEADGLAEQLTLPDEAFSRLQAAEIRQLPVGYRTVFNLFEI
ncbi:MAG: sigma factor, partial [Flavihumibacter sp.]